MAKSILHKNDTRCFVCGSHYETLDWHHIFEGTANRKLSEKYGLKVKLCHNKCHIFGKDAVHNNKELSDRLKRVGQWRFEKDHTHAEFMQVFGRNYL